MVVLTHEEMHWAVDHDYRIGRELNDAMRRRRKVQRASAAAVANCNMLWSLATAQGLRCRATVHRSCCALVRQQTRARCTLSVACCLLSVVCCMLHVVCCMLSVVGCLLHAAYWLCSVVRVARCMWSVAPYSLGAAQVLRALGKKEKHRKDSANSVSLSA